MERSLGYLATNFPSVKRKNVIRTEQEIATGIFKTPVAGKVKVRLMNLEGDEQADRTIHGGVDKAVYAYPVEQYKYWRYEFARAHIRVGEYLERI